MLSSKTLLVAVLVACSSVGAPLVAQQAPPRQAATNPPVAVASRANATPTLDGILDESVWQQATPISTFVQTEPVEGQPASEQTEVRVLYDNKAIYIGVMCYDSDPSGIITTDARRDSSLGGMDSFQMVFDTFHDRQNGFVFGTSAGGVQYDAQVRNEGDTRTGSGGAPTIGRVQSGALGGVNANWNGSWDVRTHVGETGWSAEFRIPLRTLRYGQPPQVWGLNFTRAITRKREEVYWAPLARIYNLTRLSSAGELRGLDLEMPRNLQVTPYAISSANRNFTAGAQTDTDGDWGVDAKVGLTPSMNLDLTFNTDFAQVEVDEQQINLTRFNLLFPEKRPFFLENAGLFSVGRTGEVDLFFSRRIGIGKNGSLVPIVGGARLTGKALGLNIGLLNMQTEGVGSTPANNFTGARVNRELPNRSSLGAIFVNRTATGDKAGEDNWNRTWGADGALGVGEDLTFRAFGAKTDTPGLSGEQYAYGAGGEFRTRATQAFLEYTEVAENFNPEVGFLERPDAFRKLWTGYYRSVRTPRLARWGIREMRPHGNYEAFWGFDGLLETALLHFHHQVQFEKGASLNAQMDTQFEGLRAPFEIYPGVVVPRGSYRSPYFTYTAGTDRRRQISVNMSQSVGGLLSGHQNIVAPQLNLRRGSSLIVGLRWTRSAIDLPQGDFVTNLGNVRVTYNFTTSMFAQSLIQYNDQTRRWSTNLRFSWLQTANAGLFLVYNDTEAFNGLGPVNRAFIVKYSRQFDLLR